MDNKQISIEPSIVIENEYSLVLCNVFLTNMINKLCYEQVKDYRSLDHTIN